MAIHSQAFARALAQKVRHAFRKLKAWVLSRQTHPDPTESEIIGGLAPVHHCFLPTTVQKLF